ncbi:Aldo/keto reductase [Candidatus Sulfotelmatomonas gaucii]|uniref:Aldo/keto reductase n=1 Tax=Candidatus Sulfuritelmatomonas gaucii TaxID=2043161 RepID=A0A2N9LZL4_9BACT|nr:Aldo/keto reductase [Candidatus Sulfotelmatomonas gaucii]
MRYRPLGRGPLEVSELSFGTWLTAAGGIAREQAIRCIHAALDHGITLFDTANQYGAGEAERVLGEALRAYPRGRYLIGTKLYFPVGGEPDHGLTAAQIEKQLNRSLERLGVDCIDLYQCHRYDKETPLEETMRALDRAVREGKVRAIGFSEWTAEQINAAAAIASDRSLIPFSSSQPQYSMLWRKPEAAVFPACARHGIGNLAFSPLAHGVLTGKYAPGQPPPPDSRAANDKMNMFMETAGRHYRSASLLAGVARLKPIAEHLGLTMAQMALAWVLRTPEIASAIIGATSPEQIADNAHAVGVTLSAEILERIDYALDGAIVWQ